MLQMPRVNLWNRGRLMRSTPMHHAPTIIRGAGRWYALGVSSSDCGRWSLDTSFSFAARSHAREVPFCSAGTVLESHGSDRRGHTWPTRPVSEIGTAGRTIRVVTADGRRRTVLEDATLIGDGVIGRLVQSDTLRAGGWATLRRGEAERTAIPHSSITRVEQRELDKRRAYVPLIVLGGVAALVLPVYGVGLVRLGGDDDVLRSEGRQFDRASAAAGVASSACSATARPAYFWW